MKRDVGWSEWRIIPLVVAVVVALAVAVAVGMIGLVPQLADLGSALRALAMELNYVLFMLVGLLFYQHISGKITGMGLAAGSVFILAALALS